MQTLDPPLVSALAALSAAVLMVHAGVGKRLLTWRPDAAPKRQPRKPRRHGRSGFPGGPSSWLRVPAGRPPPSSATRRC